jgi:hypothetical protein
MYISNKMSSINQLVASFTSVRIEGNENMGLILSCSDCSYSNHRMTKQQFYLLENQCCLECGTPLLPQDMDILKLRLVENTPTPVDRQFSVRAPSSNLSSASEISTYVSEDEVMESSSVECGVCREPFDSGAHRLVVLPCGHMLCFECTQRSFELSVCCVVCRKRFVKDFEPYKHLPIETREFNLCASRSFEGYPGSPLSCPEIIYSTDPLEALSIQNRDGQVIHPKKRIWIFSNGEALLVQLNHPNIVIVLHRWINVPFQFMRAISAQRSLSIQASSSCRQISNCSYNVDEEEPSVPVIETEELEPPLPVPLWGQQNSSVTSVPFTAVQDISIQFTSPRNIEFIQRSVEELTDVIQEKDQWLVGNVICPGDPITGDRQLPLRRDSPCVFRNSFRSNSAVYYDYQKIFIEIVDGVIIKFCFYNYNIKKGQTETGVPFTPVLGIHSGDSTPYRSDRGLYVHEVFHSTTGEQSEINNSPLKTFAQVAEEYRQLGFTHWVDIGSAWPCGKTLNQISSCGTSLLLYTRDTNGLPIGYPLTPYFHLTSQSVIIGIVSLTTDVDGYCNYLTLGTPTSGYACTDVQSIIATLSRLIVSRRDEIDSI